MLIEAEADGPVTPDQLRAPTVEATVDVTPGGPA